MGIGYLHDMGKSDSVFQTYLKGHTNKKVDHSSAGAKLWIHLMDNNDNYNNTRFHYYKEIVLYIIQSHHGLFDVINRENRKNKSFERLNYDEVEESHPLRVRGLK